MPTLRELQALVGSALLDEDAGGAAVHVVGDGLLPAARLAIYRHHVFSSLTATLRAAFPVVCRLVDGRFFAYLAHEYVRRHPPVDPCLFEYGASLPEFIAGFPPCAGLPYLPDVARLEWALHAAGHAGDAAPVDVDRLRRVAPGDVPRLVLRLHPSLAVLRSPWPVLRIWQANQPEADSEQDVDLAAGAACLEIRRRGDDVIVRELPVASHAFLEAVLAGRPLSVAAGLALAIDPGFDLTAALCRLLHDGLVVAIAATRRRRGAPSLTLMESKR